MSTVTIVPTNLGIFAVQSTATDLSLMFSAPLVSFGQPFLLAS